MKANIEKTYYNLEGAIIDTPNEGQLATCPGYEGYFIYKDGEWIKAEFNLKMTTYDLNKQIISQMPTLSEEEILKGMSNISLMVEHTNNKFYMLLSNEIKYYTVFSFANSVSENSPIFTEEVIACVKDWGHIKGIDLVETNDAIEIWVQPEEKEEPFVMYLFPYDGGVIECQR